MISFPTVQLSKIAQKENKTFEDAQILYEKLRELRSFDRVFGESLKTMDFDEKLLLCQGAKYEKFRSRKFVFQRGDTHNHKLYVMISGQACLILPDDVGGANGSKNAKKKFRKAFNTLRLMKALSQPEPKEKQGDESPNEKRPAKVPRPSTLIRAKSIDGFPSFKISIQRGEADPETDAAYKQDMASQANLVKPSAAVDPEFENFASDYGRIAHYLDEGECIGDFGFIDAIPRAYTVLCKTECEFIVFTKDQAHALLVKKEEEKWEFFKKVFPHLDQIFISSHNLKAFIHSFVTEVYTKGSYIINEGRSQSKAAKFYIIYKGECMLEKGVGNRRACGIAKIGSLNIFGEEILINGDEYDYSVKAVSEVVIVQTILKELFESSPLFKEFRQYVARMYPKKKQQRDTILENLKKEYQTHPELQRKDSMITSNININANSNHLMARSSLQVMSNQINREQKSFTAKMIALASLSGSQADIMLSPKRNPLEEKETTLESGRTPANNTNRFPIRVTDSDYSPKKSSALQSKLDFITKMPEVDKMAEYPLRINDIQKFKLFPEKDPKKLRQSRILAEKLSGFRGVTSQPSSPTRAVQNAQAIPSRDPSGSPPEGSSPTNQNNPYKIGKSLKIASSSMISDFDDIPYISSMILSKPQTATNIHLSQNSSKDLGSSPRKIYNPRSSQVSTDSSPLLQNAIFYKHEGILSKGAASPKKSKGSESVDLSVQFAPQASVIKPKASTLQVIDDVVTPRRDQGLSIQLDDSSRDFFTVKSLQVTDAATPVENNKVGWMKTHGKSQSFKGSLDQLSGHSKTKSISELLGSARVEARTPTHQQQIMNAGQRRKQVFKKAVLKSTIIDPTVEDRDLNKPVSLKLIA